MATTINASASSGLITTADTSTVLQLQTNGTAALTIDASANVGIGTASPNEKLQVNGAVLSTGALSAVRTSAASVDFLTGNTRFISMGADASTKGGFIWYNSTNAAVTEAMRIDSSGNVGIGTSSPAYKLDVNGVVSSNDTVRVTSGTTVNVLSTAGGGEGVVGTSSNHALQFRTNNTERMRIDSSGNLLVGKTSTALGSVGFQVDGPNGIARISNANTVNANTVWEVYSTGAAAYRFYVGMGGTVFATSTTISAISDIRYKENIRDLDVGLDKIMALKPRLYDWKEGKGVDIKNARGFIAQEFEEVFPDLIDEWQDPAPEGEEPYKSVRQDLIPVLVKAIQEQQAIITSLTDRITALEGTTP